MTTITIDRAVVEQALEALEDARTFTGAWPTGSKAITNLRAALAQAEPAAGKVVAWGVFANIDGEWQLQHPVFAGDEQGKVNSEFERASYSGPQPLEVRPLGVVTATAQQAEPPNLADPAVQRRLAAQWGYVPAAQAEPVEPVAWKQGSLVTFNEDPYPALGGLFVQFWDGEEVAARVYANDLKTLRQRCAKVNTAPPQRKPLPKHDQHCVDVPGYGLTAVRLVRAVERAHGIKK